MARSTDDLFDALADKDRRVVLDELDDGPRTREELAATLAAANGGDEQRARTQLHHVHLPLLRECGLVVVRGDRVSLPPVADRRVPEGDGGLSRWHA